MDGWQTMSLIQQIRQPHLGIPVIKNKGMSLRTVPVLCKIEVVYPADENGTNPVTVDVKEVRTSEPHLQVPIICNSPRISETPPTGILCMVAFESGFHDSPFVMGFIPGNLERQTQIQPSNKSERREIHESGSLAIQRENGSEYKQVMQNFNLIVTDEVEADGS